MSDGFVDLRLNRESSEHNESFWPSFTDIMTVIGPVVRSGLQTMIDMYGQQRGRQTIGQPGQGMQQYMGIPATAEGYQDTVGLGQISEYLQQQGWGEAHEATGVPLPFSC